MGYPIDWSKDFTSLEEAKDFITEQILTALIPAGKVSVLHQKTDFLGGDRAEWMIPGPSIVRYKEVLEKKKVNDQWLSTNKDEISRLEDLNISGKVSQEEKERYNTLTNHERHLESERIAEKKIIKEFEAYRAVIARAIELNFYWGAIKQGRMSVEDAITLINDVGLEVPANVLELREKK